MKLGIITDIHNNAVALEAVLKRLEEEKVEGIICCGDMIGIGPYPEETISMVKNIPNLMACVLGNHDKYLIEGMDLEVNMSLDEKAHHQWEHNQISDESKAFLADLNDEESLVINGKVIHVIHYAIDENNHYLTLGRNPELKEVEKAFKDISADVILYGHEHQKSFLEGDKLFINCGALGCPGRDLNLARAGLLMVDDDITFSEIEVEYDVAKVLADMDRFNYPDKTIIKKIFYGVND